MSNTWIAELAVCFIHPNGARIAGRIAIAAPISHNDKEASCFVALEGIQPSLRIHGGSTLQALMLAAQFLASRLGNFCQDGGRVAYGDDSDVPLPAIFGALWSEERH